MHIHGGVESVVADGNAMPRAGVPWLINKYKLYIVLRERLLMDTPHLRGSLSAARPGPETVTDPAYRRRGACPASQLPPSLRSCNTSTGDAPANEVCTLYTAH